jgi:predicted dithiol-disulfide oxidoreductase (DUF899 family)
MNLTDAPAPKVVSEAEWLAARDALLTKEKALTRALDALAAERRRLPMTKVEKDYVFEGPQGPVSLDELFDGRAQLLLYHFMFGPGAHGWPEAGCPGCSMYMDNLGQFAPTHLAAHGVSLALVSLAPLASIEAYRARMGWPHRWVSSAGSSFNADFGMTTPEGEKHAMSVFLRHEGAIYRTWFTSMRGLEGLGDVWRLLDVTPYGRRETWEVSPEGWPQEAPYQWWRRHDEYGAG